MKKLSNVLWGVVLIAVGVGAIYVRYEAVP
jgi:hypothetical protein